MRKPQRLDKVLSNFGFGTRSEIRKMIRDGLVKVNGGTVKDASMHIDPESSTVEAAGRLLHYRRFIYVMMNKPAGVISATYDPKLKTALDLLPEEWACFGLFPAGRLDVDTEGMLLLTNDGQLAHNLLSPGKHVEKRYYALVDGRVTQDDVRKFKEGVVLGDGYKTMPAELEIIGARPQADGGGRKETGGGTEIGRWQPEYPESITAGADRSEIELVLHEGKYHQVKRMFEAVGKRVLYLKRIQMGGLKLDETLGPGECRELTPEEVRLLGGDARGAGH